MLITRRRLRLVAAAPCRAAGADASETQVDGAVAAKKLSTDKKAVASPPVVYSESVPSTPAIELTPSALHEVTIDVGSDADSDSSDGSMPPLEDDPRPCLLRAPLRPATLAASLASSSDDSDDDGPMPALEYL